MVLYGETYTAHFKKPRLFRGILVCARKDLSKFQITFDERARTYEFEKQKMYKIWKGIFEDVFIID